VRSGDFSKDPAFDPEQLFRVIGGAESVDRITVAMRVFLDRGDAPTLARAVAVFVRSARARREPIERVLAVLIELAGEREGVAYPHDLTPSDLRQLVLRGVLLAFYGETDEKERPTRGKRRGVGER
jgi:hypothetical protein